LYFLYVLLVLLLLLLAGAWLLEFFIELILAAALWSCGRPSL